MVEDAAAMLAKGRAGALPAHILKGMLLETKKSAASAVVSRTCLLGTARLLAQGTRKKIRESDVGRECDTAARRKDTP